MSPILLIFILVVYQAIAQMIGATFAKKAGTEGNKVIMSKVAGYYFAWHLIFQIIFVLGLTYFGVI